MKKEAPRAGQIMNDKPVVVRPQDRIEDAAEKMWDEQTPVAAVVDEEMRPQGVLSHQGLLLALLDVVNHEMPAGPVENYLDPRAPTITEEISLVQMAEMFIRQGYAIRALGVVREDKLVGLVLRRDVVHAVMEYLGGVKDREQEVLYLSALKDSDERPSFE